MRYCYFILFILFSSCSPMFVAVDYDKKEDFSQYKTYEFDFGEDSGLLEFDERRFIKFTDSVLGNKGFKQSENPDFWITVSAEEYETQSNNSLGVGVGGTGGNVGVGISGGIPIGGKEVYQAVRVKLVENKSNTVFWEADSESNMKNKKTPEKRDAHYRRLVSKIFKKFPPQ